MWRAKALIVLVVGSPCSGDPIGAIHSIKAKGMAAPSLAGAWVAITDSSPVGDFTLLRRGNQYYFAARTDGCRSLRIISSMRGALFAEVRCDPDQFIGASRGYARVRLERGEMRVCRLGSEWLEDQIKRDRRLNYKMDLETVVVTSSPSRMRRYLLPYLTDDRACDDTHEDRFIRKREGAEPGSTAPF